MFNLHKFDHVNGLEPVAKCYLPLASADIKLLQSKVDFIMPDDYRDFATSYGLSRCVGYVDIVPEETLPKSVSIRGTLHFTLFFGGSKGCEGNMYGIKRILTAMRGQLPQNAIPIGTDGYGGTYLLHNQPAANRHEPGIYFLLNGITFYVANSFSAFVLNLYLAE